LRLADEVRYDFLTTTVIHNTTNDDGKPIYEYLSRLTTASGLKKSRNVTLAGRFYLIFCLRPGLIP